MEQAAEDFIKKYNLKLNESTGRYDCDGDMSEIKDPKDRYYDKMKSIYSDGRKPMILPIEEIYNGMHEGKWDGFHPQLPEVKGYNSYITKDSIRKTKGIFFPKALLFLADELNI